MEQLVPFIFILYIIGGVVNAVLKRLREDPAKSQSARERDRSTIMREADQLNREVQGEGTSTDTSPGSYDELDQPNIDPPRRANLDPSGRASLELDEVTPAGRANLDEGDRPAFDQVVRPSLDGLEGLDGEIETGWGNLSSSGSQHTQSSVPVATSSREKLTSHSASKALYRPVITKRNAMFRDDGFVDDFTDDDLFEKEMVSPGKNRSTHIRLSRKTLKDAIILSQLLAGPKALSNDPFPGFKSFRRGPSNQPDRGKQRSDRRNHD